MVLLLHGWPDDSSTWDAIIPILNDAGLRTIAPTTRGFGETRFLSPDTARTGNTAMLALDAIAMLDALRSERLSVAGHDWDANMAEMLAVGWPRSSRPYRDAVDAAAAGRVAHSAFLARATAMVSLVAGDQARRAGGARDRKGFARIMWETWSPKGWLDDVTFDRVAASFDNPWVDVTLHSYRSRWDEAEPDPQSKWLDDRVRATETLAFPTIYFQGELDGVNPPETSEKAAEKNSPARLSESFFRGRPFPNARGARPGRDAVSEALQASVP